MRFVGNDSPQMGHVDVAPTPVPVWRVVRRAWRVGSSMGRGRDGPTGAVAGVARPGSPGQRRGAVRKGDGDFVKFSG